MPPSKVLSFQEIISRLQNYWTSRGCILWHPHHEMVGAGTYNPATFLRAIGPEQWNVCYVEPSFRPDDGRYAENPNRMQMHHQYQVLLQPPPMNPQELYLESLFELGIVLEQHDIRFVEDNWESPALSAWGLGWEVWLDGMEITQFTYFQQSGGIALDPPACELTYGLERLAMFLQGVTSVWDLTWDGKVSYADVLKKQEVEYCQYNFEAADVERVQRMFELYEAEAKHCLQSKLAMPGYDYLVRCSHAFNILDARGAIGLSERVKYFGRMRAIAREYAQVFLASRESAGFPLMKQLSTELPAAPLVPNLTPVNNAQTFVLEIGVEELAAYAVPQFVQQLKIALPKFFEDLRIAHGEFYVSATPRRLGVLVQQVAPAQPDALRTFKGPAKSVCQKNPQALAGFCRKNGLLEADVRYEQLDGVECAVARVEQKGRGTVQVLSEALPKLIAQLSCDSSMRWLDSQRFGEEAKQAFNRPIRWLLCLLGSEVVPFRYAGVCSGRTTCAGRWERSRQLSVGNAQDYREVIRAAQIELDSELRMRRIREQIEELAAEVDGHVKVRQALLEECTYLLEFPTAFLCSFDPKFLSLPAEVIVSTMEKHVRCFALYSAEGELLPKFIGVRNGGSEQIESVRWGYERLIAARFADAKFFIERDLEQPLQGFNERIKKLVFHAQIGSMFDKSQRLQRLAQCCSDPEKPLLWLALDRQALLRAAELAKADLGTQMVTEMTSLQGSIGRIYALRAGESATVALALFEQYLPRQAGDVVPTSNEGLALAILDRVDTLASLFAVGVEPTGSADPFGLRREAQSLISCLVERTVSVDLRQLLLPALSALARQTPVAEPEAVVRRVLEFVAKRLEVVLREHGIRHDVIRASLVRSDHNPLLAAGVARELHVRVLDSTGAALSAARAVVQSLLRCQNILKVAREKRLAIATELQLGIFKEPAEQALLAALQQHAGEFWQPSIVGCASGATSIADFGVRWAAFEKLTPTVALFFEKIMVMDEDQTLRASRLGLLATIAAILDCYIDVQQLEGFSLAGAHS